MIVVGLGLSVLAGVIPVIVYGWFVYWLDRYEKEPWWLLALSFGWGAVPAVILSLLSQVILGIPTTWILTDSTLAQEIVGASLWAPLTEEFFKGLGVVLIIIIAHREIDSILDGIVYGAMAGLGFAFVENILYFVGALSESGFGMWVVVVFIRTVLFGLNHAFFSGLVGGGLALLSHGKNIPIKIIGPVGGFAAAVMFHAAHNFGAILSSEYLASIFISLIASWGGIIILGIIIGLIWREEQRWMVEQLQGEVNADVFQTITSWRHWFSQRGAALLHGDFKRWRQLGRLRHASTELAFKKMQVVQFGTAPDLDAAIARYRAELAKLGAIA